MLTYAFLAALTTASALIFLRRLTTWRTIIRFRAAIDVLFTIALFGIFAGTLGGAVVAALGGLMLSICLGIASTTQKAAKSVQNGPLKL